MERLYKAIRNIHDFPKKGIVYKDITPILKDPELMKEALNHSVEMIKPLLPEAIAGIEARGFIMGALLAEKLNLPFIPLRKPGKLPFHTHSIDYSLEYGEASLEIHTDALHSGQRVVIHDDILATGGTAKAAQQLIEKCGGVVAGHQFLLELTFLQGRSKLKEPVLSLLKA